MKKILYSAGLIVFVAALALGATGAFFSDSETSTGNILTAGAIDLQIDNESYVTSTTTGLLVASPNTTWTMRNLTVEKFFDFEDIKPGDIGEDTISLHVDNNDAYLCADVTLTSNNENTLVDPESDDGDDTTGTNGGELAQQVNFAWWADDGDNVLEEGENLLPGGPLGNLAIGATTTVTLADSVSNIWTGQGGTIPGASQRYIVKPWCLGTITPAPVAQDGSGNNGENGPLDRGTGFICDGSLANNTAQTDSLTADVAFRAVQSRNNSRFLCTPSTAPETATVTLDKVVTFTNLAVAGADVSDFTLHLVGPGGDHVLIDQVPFPGLTPGAYVVSEVYSGDPANATSTVIFSGSCTEIGTTDTATFNVVSGVNPTCTITNSVSTTTPQQ